MEIVIEVFSDSQNHKAIILKKGNIFEVHFYKYFPGFIDGFFLR